MSENNFAACFAATLQVELILSFLVFPVGKTQSCLIKALLKKYSPCCSLFASGACYPIAKEN